MAASLVVAASALLASCDTDLVRGYPARAGGDPARGRAVVTQRHCGACHTIPRVRGANGVVGPPLTSFARRGWVAGELPNTPDNVTRWVKDPRAIEPGTAMPVVGLTDREARDVAAFLDTLR